MTTEINNITKEKCKSLDEKECVEDIETFT